MKVSYSAPAKVILSGEHASVYGKPTLISSLDLRLSITIFRKKVMQKDSIIKMISTIVLKYLKDNKIKHDALPYGYEIKSEIPQGSNLGSSAALSVAACAAFLEFYTGKVFSKEIVNFLAYEVEKFFHGTPSGGDNSASCYGGLIFFRKEFDFLKSISRLPIQLPKVISSRLFIVSSGTPEETTKDLVSTVSARYEKNNQRIKKVIDEIEKTTKQIVICIKDKDVKGFEECIVQNEAMLERLGVVSDNTKKLLNSLKKFGAGKVTGAGGIKKGSGNLLFFARNVEQVKKYFSTHNIEYRLMKVDNDGLKKL